MTSGRERYRVELHRNAERFFRNHRELASNWEGIRQRISMSPKQGGQITHMKGQWHCDYRWRQGVYRLLYEIIDDENLVHVYHANTRGDVYG